MSIALKNRTVTALLLLCAVAALTWKYSMRAGAVQTHGALPQAVDLFAPYWYIDSSTRAWIHVANESTSARVVQPTLLVNGADAYDLSAESVPAHGTIRIPIPQIGQRSSAREKTDSTIWGDGSIPGSVWGSARLNGESLAGVSAWIVSENPSQSLSMTSAFSAPQETPELLGAYWRPTPATSVLYALYNVGESAITLETHFGTRSRSVAGQPIRLSAKSARLLSLNELLPKGEARLAKEPAGSVRFVANLGNTVVGQVVVADAQAGFSTPVALKNAVTTRMSGVKELAGALFGQPDPSMGFASETRFTPRLLVTSSSSNRLKIRATLHGRDKQGRPVQWTTQPLQVGAFATELFDLDQLRRRHSRIGDGHVGITLVEENGISDYTADVITTDDALTFSSYEPFVDKFRTASHEAAVSFDLRGTRDSLLIVRNTAEAPVYAMYVVNYTTAEGRTGSYMRDLSIPPGAPTIIDVKVLRDQAVPDMDGNIIPKDVEFGHLGVAAIEQVLVAIDVTFDPKTGTCEGCPNGDGCTGGPGEGFEDITVDFGYAGVRVPPWGSVKYCDFHACHTNDCGSGFVDVINKTDSCAAGIREQYNVETHWGGFKKCTVTSHNHLADDPC
jgi:hypothetical protein